ncbi:MAG: hypothetical protein NTX45_14270 [Proteobacteria bacterium]|nr:hypothetical protein [Pseudomonadota bacterium]
MDYEKQSAFVIDFKRILRDQETFQDARVLLGKLRKRRDLKNKTKQASIQC